jgi:hypothetical protein
VTFRGLVASSRSLRLWFSQADSSPKLGKSQHIFAERASTAHQRKASRGACSANISTGGRPTAIGSIASVGCAILIGKPVSGYRWLKLNETESQYY